MVKRGTGMGSLTATKVRGLSKPGRYGDGGGLYLSIAKGGSKSWIMRLRVDGKRTDKGLGGYPTFRCRRPVRRRRSTVA